MLDEILESATAVTSDSEDYRGEDGLLIVESVIRREKPIFRKELHC